MKRILASTILFFYLVFVSYMPAHAYLPAFMAPAVCVACPMCCVAGLIVSVGIFGTLYYQSSKQGGSSGSPSVRSDGTIVDPGKVTWVDLSGPNGTPNVKSQSVNGTMSYSDVKATVAANPGAATALASHLTVQNSNSPPVGSVITLSGQNYNVLSSSSGSSYDYTSSIVLSEIANLPNGTLQYVTRTITGPVTASWALDGNGQPVFSYYTSTIMILSPTSSPANYSSGSSSPATAQQFSDAMNSDTAARSQIPDILAANPTAIKLQNPDGSAFVTPPGALSPDQAQAAAMKEYQAQLESLKASAAAAARDAQAAANAAASAAAAGASNAATLAQAAQNANATAASWNSAYQSLLSGGTGSMTSGYPVTSGSGTFPTYTGPGSTATPPSSPGSSGSDGSTGGVNGNGFSAGKYGDNSSFDFGARFTTFIGDMKKTPLFSLPDQFMGSLPTGGTSQVSFSAGSLTNNQTLTYDFARWGDAFNILKIIVLMIFSVIAFKIVTLKGGGN